MPVHFSAEEMRGRRAAVAGELRRLGLEALLIFKQESMYYLTGYDTFGFSLFQCLVFDADGNANLFTRLPDLRQAKYTSNLSDDQIHIWTDRAGVDPVDELKALLDRLGLGQAHLGIELDSYGLKASAWIALEARLREQHELEDASTLIDRVRSVKSEAELDCVRRAAELADDAFDACLATAGPGAFEGDILAAMQGAERGFDRDIGAVSGWADDRTYNLIPQRHRYHAGAYGGR